MKVDENNENKISWEDVVYRVLLRFAACFFIFFAMYVAARLANGKGGFVDSVISGVAFISMAITALKLDNK